jgi:hypothetical protein
MRLANEPTIDVWFNPPAGGVGPGTGAPLVFAKTRGIGC